MIRLELLGPHTRLLSTLCAACPHNSAGCCVAPPPFDWSDIGRVAALGGRDFLLEQLAAGNLQPAANGLRLRRVRRRERPEDRRQNKCVFHGTQGCTIDPARRPATCNYYLCEETFAAGGERRGEPAPAAARRAHAALHAIYGRWDEELARGVAAAWPEGPPWDAAFLDWLAEEYRRLEAEAGDRLPSLAWGVHSSPP